MKLKEMKEFDKIYIAKYKNILTKRQLAEDLRVSQNEIQNVIEELEKQKLIEIYNNISDIEWEKLEKKKDDEIKIKYYKYSKIINENCFKQIIKNFKETKLEFPIFSYVNYELKMIKDSAIVNERWKKIPGFEYSISDYGRTRNDKTKKIKPARMHRWMVQVDIYKDGKRYTINVSRMVANLFIRQLNTTERVTHIDGDKRNNYYKNLKIVCK